MNVIHTQDSSGAVQQLAQTLRTLLSEDKKVLWLVSGGSGGKVTVEVSKLLQGIPLDNLFVTLSDERYGPVGHKDENWQILLDDGLSLAGATTYRPLIGESREETAIRFGSWLNATVEQVDQVVGLFGIGSDGHTAGIKPGSSSVTSTETVDHFQGDDFERITITPAFFSRVDEGVLQAFGADKHEVIRQLLHDTIALDVQPAQILNKIPKLTVYSDYKES